MVVELLLLAVLVVVVLPVELVAKACPKRARTRNLDNMIGKVITK